MIKITSKALRIEQKLLPNIRCWSSLLFNQRNTRGSKATLKLKHKIHEITNVAFFSASRSNFFSQDSSSQKKLKLMDMPLTKFPNIFSLIGLRLRIAFQMMQIDKSFKFGDFLIGAEQVM